MPTDAEDRAKRLNRLMTGWANCFCLGPVSKAYRALDAQATFRLRGWLCKKHEQAGPNRRVGEPHASPTGGSTTSWGCTGCPCGRATFRGRRHEALSERRMRENRTSGATSGD